MIIIIIIIIIITTIIIIRGMVQSIQSILCSDLIDIMQDISAVTKNHQQNL
jgi:hypothetical protein